MYSFYPHCGLRAQTEHNTGNITGDIGQDVLYSKNKTPSCSGPKVMS